MHAIIQDANTVLSYLSCQRSCQQLGANKVMYILDNSQTLNPLI